jgi:hypothetical protein
MCTILSGRVGQRPEDHGVDDAENRRRGANPERQRGDCGERERRLLSQGADGVRQVGQQDVHEWGSEFGDTQT